VDIVQHIITLTDPHLNRPSPPSQTSY